MGLFICTFVLFYNPGNIQGINQLLSLWSPMEGLQPYCSRWSHCRSNKNGNKIRGKRKHIANTGSEITWNQVRQCSVCPSCLMGGKDLKIRFRSDIRKRFFSVGWWGTGTGRTEELWRHQAWKYSKSAWMWPWAVWSSRKCPCPRHGVGNWAIYKIPSKLKHSVRMIRSSERCLGANYAICECM